MTPDELDAILAVCARHGVGYLKTAAVEVRLNGRPLATEAATLEKAPNAWPVDGPVTYEELRKVALAQD